MKLFSREPRASDLVQAFVIAEAEYAGALFARFLRAGQTSNDSTRGEKPPAQTHTCPSIESN